MMFASRAVYASLALLAPVAFAQSAQEPGEPARHLVHQSVRDADSQQRRATLRASLKSPHDSALAPDGAPRTPPLMSDQKRAVLRQQLRQQ